MILRVVPASQRIAGKDNFFSSLSHQLTHVEAGGKKRQSQTSQFLLAHGTYFHWHACQRIPHTIGVY